MKLKCLDEFRRAWHGVRSVGPALLVAAGSMFWAGQALALGSMLDVQVVERDSGQVLHPYAHRGSHYVAGRPGARYAIRVSNRTGGRVLAVMSVDGVNIVSGQTASWNQGGYVLEPWQTHEITGWRKSRHEVAAFEFTVLPDSYAARTGRPNEVGVIGVAVFAERAVAPAPFPEMSRDDSRGRHEGRAGASAEKSAQAEAPAAAADAANHGARRSAPEPAAKLGTGHGARETSHASTTTFVRNSHRPLELVSIRYDSFENLARAGIVRDIDLGHPRAFPKSQSHGFVPDPPRW